MMFSLVVFFFKQKTAYERRISDWFRRVLFRSPDSPAILLTTSAALARDTMQEIERLLAILPTADHARKAWENFGEVIVADSDAEMVAIADGIASEHVQGITRHPAYFLAQDRKSGGGGERVEGSVHIGGLQITIKN